MNPTQSPTEVPTQIPTKTPTQIPTEPTDVPTQNPTKYPTLQSSKQPTNVPTQIPTNVPTQTPTNQPITNKPTYTPTCLPTIDPKEQKKKDKKDKKDQEKSKQTGMTEDQLLAKYTQQQDSKQRDKKQQQKQAHKSRPNVINLYIVKTLQFDVMTEFEQEMITWQKHDLFIVRNKEYLCGRMRLKSKSLYQSCNTQIVQYSTPIDIIFDSALILLQRIKADRMTRDGMNLFLAMTMETIIPYFPQLPILQTTMLEALQTLENKYENKSTKSIAVVEYLQMIIRQNDSSVPNFEICPDVMNVVFDFVYFLLAQFSVLKIEELAMFCRQTGVIDGNTTSSYIQLMNDTWNGATVVIPVCITQLKMQLFIGAWVDYFEQTMSLVNEFNMVKAQWHIQNEIEIWRKDNIENRGSICISVIQDSKMLDFLLERLLYTETHINKFEVIHKPMQTQTRMQSKARKKSNVRVSQSQIRPLT
eukprot:195575_1